MALSIREIDRMLGGKGDWPDPSPEDVEYARNLMEPKPAVDWAEYDRKMWWSNVVLAGAFLLYVIGTGMALVARFH